jgi:hypothetical protein
MDYVQCFTAVITAHLLDVQFARLDIKSKLILLACLRIASILIVKIGFVVYVNLDFNWSNQDSVLPITALTTQLVITYAHAAVPVLLFHHRHVYMQTVLNHLYSTVHLVLLVFNYQMEYVKLQEPTAVIITKQF